MAILSNIKQIHSRKPNSSSNFLQTLDFFISGIPQEYDLKYMCHIGLGKDEPNQSSIRWCNT